MAEYQYQWKQNMNYGGFADDRFLGIKNSFASAKSVEIRRNPHSLKLSNVMHNDNKDDQGNTITFNDFIGSFVTVKSTGTILACGRNGLIYRKIFGQIGWTLIYTLDLSSVAKERIINCIEYNDYIYFLTESQIHRIAVSDVDGSNWAVQFVPGYKNFGVGSYNYRPAIEVNNNLYIGDGRYVGELSSTGVWTYNKISVFSDEEVVALTFGGSFMRIFGTKNMTSAGKKNPGSRKYYWDTTSSSWNESVPFEEPIHAAISNGGSDYVIAGLQPWIYLSSGYDFIKTKRLPFILDTERCYLGANCLDYYGGLLAFAFQFPFGDANGYKGKEGRGVWTFGKEDPKYPDSLNFDYPSSQYDLYDAGSQTYPYGRRVYFGAIHNSNGVLYVSYAMYGAVGSAALSYGIEYLDSSKFAVSGELVSLVNYGIDAATDKASIEVKMAFKKLAAGEKIELFIANNLGEFPATPELSASYAYTPDSGATYPDRNICNKAKDIALDSADYNFLQTKVVLTSGTNQATTPELIEVILGFNDVELGD